MDHFSQPLGSAIDSGIDHYKVQKGQSELAICHMLMLASHTQSQTVMYLSIASRCNSILSS